MLKNVVIVSDFGYINGGNSKVALDNTLILSQKYNVYLFIGESKLDTRIENYNINVITTNSTEFMKSKNKAKAFLKFVYDKDVYKQFDSLLKTLDNNETIIHIHSWPKVLSPSIFKAISKNGFKTLITCHDYFSVCPNGGLYNYKKKCICKCKNRLSCFFSNCDSRSYIYKMVRNVRFNVQNRYMKQVEKKGLLNFGIISKSQEGHFKKYFNKAGYYYIPNNIELYQGKIIDANSNNRFIYVGRLSEEKGVDRMVSIFKKLPQYNLDIVGDGDLMERYSKESIPNIVFHGWKTRTEINKLLQEVRCLVFPSVWYEGSPLTIPEIMSAGIPCVVSKISNGKDFIEDGINGWLVDVDSEDDFISKIKMISSTDISVVSSNARKIINNYSSDIYNHYFDSIEEIMDRS